MRLKPWMAWLGVPAAVLSFIAVLSVAGDAITLPARLQNLEKSHGAYKDEMTRRVDSLTAEMAGLRSEVGNNARRAEDSYQRLIAAVTEGNAQMKAMGQQISEITAKQMLTGEQVKNTQVLIDSLAERLDRKQ